MGCLPDKESIRAADEDIVQAYRHAHRVLRAAPDEVFEDAHTVEMYDLKMKSHAMIEAKYPEGIAPRWRRRRTRRRGAQRDLAAGEDGRDAERAEVHWSRG